MNPERHQAMLGGIFWSRPTSHLYHEVWDVLQRSDLARCAISTSCGQCRHGFGVAR